MDLICSRGFLLNILSIVLHTTSFQGATQNNEGKEDILEESDKKETDPLKQTIVTEKEESLCKIGDLINGTYEIIDLLGEGTYGEVYHGFDRSERVDCAIKLFRSGQKIDESATEEYLILMHLSKFNESLPHVVQCLGNGNNNGNQFICMELLGLSIGKFLHRNYAKGLPIEMVYSFGKQMALSLEFLQKKEVVHADFKPDNILLSLDARSCKISDFGMSFFHKDNKGRRLLQSQFYRCPEVLLRMDAYSYPIDIFAMGCILYELCTGDVLLRSTDESDLFVVFCELMDAPALSFVKGSTKAAVFMDMEKGRPLYMEDGVGLRRRPPKSRNIEKKMPFNTGDVMKIIRGCLTWNPDERMGMKEIIDILNRNAGVKKGRKKGSRV